MKTVREGLVVILPRNDALVDVFTGIGWKNHTVFSVLDDHTGEPLTGPVKVKGPDIGVGPFNFLSRTLGYTPARKEAA